MPDDFAELRAAYEGVEDPARFESRAALERYRLRALEASTPQADFIEQRLPESAGALEIGCGNGRLLIELARRGSVAEALGVDLAPSRIDFAARWAADLGLDSLEWRVGDALSLELGHARSFDTALCVTGAFGYFEAFRPGAALTLARRLYDVLHPGGLIVLELYPRSEWRRIAEAAGGSVNLWRELPEPDPWRFYLSSIQLNGDVLFHDKTFVHRTQAEIDTGRSERLYLYDEPAIAQLLEQAGFEHEEHFADWGGTPYDGGELLIVTARAKAEETAR